MRVSYWFFFFSSRRRHTRWPRDWSSDVCSSDLLPGDVLDEVHPVREQVADHAAAAPGPVVAPGQRTLGGGGIVGDQPAAHVGDPAQAAGGDQLAQVGDRGGRSEERRVGKWGGYG